MREIKNKYEILVTIRKVKMKKRMRILEGYIYNGNNGFIAVKDI